MTRAFPVLATVAAFIGPRNLPAQRPAPAPATSDAGEWSLPGRDYALTRFAPLDQINRANVAQLRPVWTFSTGALRGHEGNPLVVGATLYVHTPYPNQVFALDLSQPGAPIQWRYAPPIPRNAPVPLTGCCDVGSRGLAYHPSGKLYVPLLSGELAALDAASGRELWRVRNADPRSGATLAGAPLVVHDLVIVGVSGAEYGVRGHLTAYDALSGRLVWRGYSTGPDSEVLLAGPANPAYPSHQSRDLGVTTWPTDAWRQGGGTTSGWLSYDPVLDLVFYGTDQPAPGNPALRGGDNKWTASLIAREAGSGRVRWAYQLTPHDEWGFGGSNENILADLVVRGNPVKALVHFDRNGFAYTLDRATGRVLLAERYGPTNWARVIDLQSGVPQTDPRFAAPVAAPPPSPSPAGGAKPAAGPPAAGICPGSIGTKWLQPAAYSPLTNLFYVPLNNLCMELRTGPASYVAGQPYAGATIKLTVGPGGTRGRFIAWDAASATIAWELKEPLAVAGGALATAGGLVFYGTLEGWLKAVDQKTGRELWRFKTPSGIVGNPIAFQGPDGKEYVAILSGVGGWWGLGGNGAFPDLSSVTTAGGVLMVFGL
ncbi:MAG TPA: PQQ-dependent dehydrogenase, methanol/ethanol family [Gemmatimonadales bacterium]|nr:PQQ-dependent dehydrogenase, methanol/ethanol family [Gemmatimonadales bacterium]